MFREQSRVIAVAATPSRKAIAQPQEPTRASSSCTCRVLCACVISAQLFTQLGTMMIFEMYGKAIRWKQAMHGFML
jgi:hypothetical protein